MSWRVFDAWYILRTLRESLYCCVIFFQFVKYILDSAEQLGMKILELIVLDTYLFKLISKYLFTYFAVCFLIDTQIPEEDRASTRVAHIEKYIRTYVRKGGLDYFWFYDQTICPQYIWVGRTMVQGPAGHLSRATRSRAQSRKVSFSANNTVWLYSSVYCCV